MNDQTLIEFSKQMNDVAAAMIELEAMKQANRYADFHNKPTPYREEDFRKLLEVYDLGYNENIVKLRNFYS